MSPSAFALALTVLLLNVGAVSAQESASNEDGKILEQELGFPFDTYEQWLQDRRARFAFDETEFREKFPPDRFDEYKDEIQCPFETYEEWLQALKRRLRRSRFDESLFRERYPPEDFARYKDEIEYARIKYLSDGLQIAGYILRPKRDHEKPLPVIIYNRGGNRDIGKIDFEKLYTFFDLISKGYVLIASQYRGCSESEGKDEFGGADVNDVLNLLVVADSLPYVDSSRIGMYGWSRGGMMTYLALTRTHRIAAAVVGAAPTDLTRSVNRRAEAEELFSSLIPNFVDEREEVLRSRSAIYWSEKLPRKTPILLLQGSADWRNDPMDALRLASRLYETKHPFRLVFFEGGDHGLSEYEDDVRDLVSSWFDNYVRDRRPWPSLEPHGD